mgnify:CR=1
MRAIEIIGPLFSPCEAARSAINYESGGKTGAAGRLTFSEGILMLQKNSETPFSTEIYRRLFVSAADKKRIF